MVPGSSKERLFDSLSELEKKQARQLTVWLVWYEDRFGWGEDRDPAFVLDAFLTEEEANAYAILKGGFIDIESGKFDGQFVDKSLLSEAAYLEVIPLERIRELIGEAVRKKIIE